MPWQRRWRGRRNRGDPEALEQPGADGDIARARIGWQAYDINAGQFCCRGLNFGYFYPDSPIIAYDGEAAPTTSANPPFRGVALRICGCATGDLFMTPWKPISRCYGSMQT